MSTMLFQRNIGKWVLFVLVLCIANITDGEYDDDALPQQLFLDSDHDDDQCEHLTKHLLLSKLLDKLTNEDVGSQPMSSDDLSFMPESNMTTAELIQNMGYDAESHNVTTEDGYQIEIHRVISRAIDTAASKPPVLLQHGLFGCSSTWVVNYPNQSLGFMLADAGFDVWLSNIRGSPYGRSHKSLDPHSEQFWDFSFDEAATNDLSSVIDYVLETTNYDQLHYVGHSMGTTMGFVLLSTRPQYNNKIKMFFALAPAAYVHHMKSRLLRLIIHFKTAFKTIMSAFHLYWFPPSDGYSPLMDEVCPPYGRLCTDLIGEICGPNSQQTNQSRISVYIHQLFKMTSLRTLTHYGQIYASEKFRHFDWGFFKNLRVYGWFRPPSYPLESITTPTLFFGSRNDYITTMDDITLLSQRLPHHLATFIADDPQWNHLDFVTSMNAGPVINQHVIEWMKKAANRV